MVDHIITWCTFFKKHCETFALWVSVHLCTHVLHFFFYSWDHCVYFLLKSCTLALCCANICWMMANKSSWMCSGCCKAYYSHIWRPSVTFSHCFRADTLWYPLQLYSVIQISLTWRDCNSNGPIVIFPCFIPTLIVACFSFFLVSLWLLFAGDFIWRHSVPRVCVFVHTKTYTSMIDRIWMEYNICFAKRGCDNWYVCCSYGCERQREPQEEMQ